MINASELDLCRLIVQSIYLVDPSQIATESFSSPFFSEKHTFHHIKSLEKSKKGKIQNFYCDNIAPQVRHENEAAYSNLLLHGSFDHNSPLFKVLAPKEKTGESYVAILLNQYLMHIHFSKFSMKTMLNIKQHVFCYFSLIKALLASLKKTPVSETPQHI